jgi:acetylornithine deacetylase/succinyl-diaminopimelate desuccinylase-like protein
MLLALMAAGGCRQTVIPAASPDDAAAQPGPVQAAGEWPQAADAQKVQRDFEALLRLAPRPSGSDRLEACRRLIEAELAGAGLSVRREPFQAATTEGGMAMANVIGERAGDPRRIVYVATHIDTKRILGVEFVGANDSGSSTAAVLEIARVVAARAGTRATYRFIFFDGEEAFGESITETDGLYGSRHHAEGLRRSGEARRVRAMILLDMIGDRDLALTRDLNSSPELWELLTECCNRLGYPDIVAGGTSAIIDDHMPFRELGIPAVDAIDFEYGPWNSYWHTAADGPENVSVANIVRMTRVTLCMLESLERE